MIIEEGLTAFLKATSPAIASGRVYPYSQVPQSATYPLVTYQRISGPRTRDLSGPAGSATPRYQIDVLAETYAAARSAATQVRQRLDGYSGLMGTVTVTAVVLDSERDIPYDDEVDIRGVSMDFFISHAEV